MGDSLSSIKVQRHTAYAQLLMYYETRMLHTHRFCLEQLPGLGFPQPLALMVADYTLGHVPTEAHQESQESPDTATALLQKLFTDRIVN